MAFKDFVEGAKKETKSMVDVTKQKAKISKCKSDIKDNYEKIGEYIYKNARALLADVPKMEDIMVENDKLFDEITQCEDEIARIKVK